MGLRRTRPRELVMVEAGEGNALSLRQLAVRPVWRAMHARHSWMEGPGIEPAEVTGEYWSW